MLTLLKCCLHVLSSRGDNLLETSGLHGLVSPSESHSTCTAAVRSVCGGWQRIRKLNGVAQHDGSGARAGLTSLARKLDVLRDWRAAPTPDQSLPLVNVLMRRPRNTGIRVSLSLSGSGIEEF